MRILQVIPFFGPRHGGAFTVPFQTAKTLKDLGHEVTIITSDFQFDGALARLTEGLEILPFKTIFAVGSFYYTPSMRKWLDKNIDQFDVVHIHSIRTYQNLVVNRSVIKWNKPYIIQAHGSLPTNIGSSALKRIYDLIFRSQTVRAASAVIAVNSTELNDYASYGFDKNIINLIYNGININNEHKSPATFNNRGENKVDSDLPLILFVGRLDKIKGTDIFVQALSHVDALGTDFVAFVVGPDYGLKDEVNAMISSLGLNGKVLIIGPKDGQQLKSIYSEANLVVIPSRYDAFPMVLLEACLAQVPVVLSTRCLVADLFKDYCHLADPEPNDMCRSIIHVLNNMGDALELAQGARDLVVSRFNIRQTAKDTLDLYSEVIGGDRHDRHCQL